MKTSPELASKWSDVRRLLFLSESDSQIEWNREECKWQWKKRMEQTCETFRKSSQEKIEKVRVLTDRNRRLNRLKHYENPSRERPCGNVTRNKKDGISESQQKAVC